MCVVPTEASGKRSRGHRTIPRPVPIKEDFYPKRPTRASRFAALGPVATLVALVIAVALGHDEEVSIVMAMETVFLAMLFFVGLASDGESRFVKWFTVTWALVLLTGGAVAMTWDTGSWTPLAGLVGIVVAHAKTIVRRDALVERDMLTARAGLGFLAAWLLLFVAGAVTLFHPRLALALWALLFFGLLAAVELFRILVVPPPEAGPDWWKWDPTRA